MHGRARDLAAGLNERNRRLVIDRLGVHRADDGDVVDHLRRVRQQLGHPGAVLPVLRELEGGRRDREARLARRHRGETLALANRVGQILVEPVVHLRLVVEGLHLRRRADHVQVDRALGLGREVRQSRAVLRLRRDSRRQRLLIPSPADWRARRCRVLVRREQRTGGAFLPEAFAQRVRSGAQGNVFICSTPRRDS